MEGVLPGSVNFKLVEPKKVEPKKVDEPVKVEEEVELCPICLVVEFDDHPPRQWGNCFCFPSKQGTRELECGHKFCDVCIQTWLTHNQTCPTCRGDAQTSAPGPQIMGRIGAGIANLLTIPSDVCVSTYDCVNEEPFGCAMCAWACGTCACACTAAGTCSSNLCGLTFLSCFIQSGFLFFKNCCALTH